MTVLELINDLIKLNRPGALIDIQLADMQCYQISDVYTPDDDGDIVFLLATQAGYRPAQQ